MEYLGKDFFRFLTILLVLSVIGIIALVGSAAWLVSLLFV